MQRFQKFIPLIGFGLIGALIAGGAVWAVMTVMQPAEDPLDATSYTYVRVTPGEVGSSMQLNTVAEWESTPVAANRAAGIVTAVTVKAGAEVKQGSELYSVDLRPVVIGAGSVPMFRDVGAGMTGADVKQLQQLLTDLGFYDGPVGGQSGAGTAKAIVAWQKSLGMEQTGVVGVGDVIFVPTLPTRVALDSSMVFPGASLSGGEAAVSELPVSPTFTIPATDAQAALIPTGSRVEITASEGGTWQGFTGEQTRDAGTGTVMVRLAGKDGATICGDQCDQVPVSGQTLMASRVVRVETVEGLVVPSSALVTDAKGQVAVVDEQGDRRPVSVKAAARGMSVIEGIGDGTRVRVPGEVTK